MYAPVAERLGVTREVAKVAVLGAMYGQTTGQGAVARRGLESAYPVAMDTSPRLPAPPRAATICAPAVVASCACRQRAFGDSPGRRARSRAVARDGTDATRWSRVRQQSSSRSGR